MFLTTKIVYPLQEGRLKDENTISSAQICRNIFSFFFYVGSVLKLVKFSEKDHQIRACLPTCLRFTRTPLVRVRVADIFPLPKIDGRVRKVPCLRSPVPRFWGTEIPIGDIAPFGISGCLLRRFAG